MLFCNQLEKKKISQYQVIKHGIRVEHWPEAMSCSKGYFSWFIRAFKEACGMPREEWRLQKALHCSASAFVTFVYVWGWGVGERLRREVEQLLTRLIMGTNLPVVTLFNDMLLGSAPRWGRDSSAAGAAWWIAAGSWWCNHSLACTATAPPDTCPRWTWPPGCPAHWETRGLSRGALLRPCTFLCRAFL